MIVNGKFIKETPPKIGAYYAQGISNRTISAEEYFVQGIMLGHMPYTTSFWNRLVAKVLAV